MSILINPIQTDLDCNVINLGYNLVAVKINGTKKVLYIHKFPPANNTTSSPDLRVESKPEEMVSQTNLTKEMLIDFWSSTEKYQANGDWKGGEWGSNNLATTDKTFCTGIFIGDNIKIKFIKYGIIPYKIRSSKPFEIEDESIDGTENFAWSCNIELSNGSQYSGYVCNEPMPQSAIDVLFVWKNSKSKRYAKILRRGNPHPNVDMPNMLMPGAGEHREPGLNVSFKADALRAVEEEIGLPTDTLTQCYLLPVGKFDDPKRDPRYCTWTWINPNTSQIIEFGIQRESWTDVFVLYIESDTDIEPMELVPLDKIEVSSKKWIGLDELVESKKDIWMIPEHQSYFNHSRRMLDRFDDMSTEYKIGKKIIL